MLDDILERFEAAEVDGNLHFRLEAGESGRMDRDGNRRSIGDRPQRVGQAVLVQDRGIDASCKRPKVLEGVVHLRSDRPEGLLASQRILLQHLDRQIELYLQTQELLLDAIMQVALDASPLCVGGLYEADPRGGQL